MTKAIKKGKITCAFCKGTGILPKGSDLEAKCPSCRGEGAVHLEKAVSCAYCKGKGRKRGMNYNLPCQVCQGVGAVELSGSSITCPSCNGAGEKTESHLPCLTCKGTGFVEK